MKFYDLLLTLQLRVIGEETSCVVALLLPIKFNKLRLISSLGNGMHVFEVYSLLKWARLMAHVLCLLHTNPEDTVSVEDQNSLY